MAATQETVAVFAKYDNLSKILCTERCNLMDCIRRKFEIKSDFHIEQLKKNQKDYIKVTSLTVRNMAMIRVIENSSSGERYLDCAESLAKKPKVDKALTEEERNRLLSTYSGQPKSVVDYVERLAEKLKGDDELTGEDRKYFLDLFSGQPKPFSAGLSTGRSQKVSFRKKVEPNIPEAWQNAYNTLSFLRKEAQEKEEDRDSELIARLLKESFEDRRNFILQQGPRVKQIKQSYPILFEKKYFFEEFERILGSNCISEFHKNLETYCIPIINLVQDSSLLDVIRNQQKKFSPNENIETLQSSYVNMAGALLVLPTLCKNNLNHIIQFETRNTSWGYPIILCPASVSEALSQVPLFKIYAEEYFLIETDNLIEAFIMYLSVFFMFDISYPTKGFLTLTLIETFLFGHAASSETAAVKKIRKMIQKQ